MKILEIFLMFFFILSIVWLSHTCSTNLKFIQNKLEHKYIEVWE